MILLVALVVLGPSRLPQTARKIGGWASELRRAASELRAGLEAEVGDVSEITRQFREPVNDLKQAVSGVGDDVKKATDSTTWVGEKPLSGPTPADAMADLEEIERSGGEGLTDHPEPPIPEDVDPEPTTE